MIEVRPGAGGRRAALALGGLLAAALVAPWAAPYPANAVLDPIAARDRPPGTVLLACELADGRTLLADRATEAADGRWIVERAGRVTVLAAGALARPPVRQRHLLGTDRLGRDLLTRLLHGGRNSLLIALTATVLSLALGTAAGLVAAYSGGALDTLLMRAVDILAALPRLFVLLAIAAIVAPGPAPLTVWLAAVSWMALARQVRAEALVLRRAEFTQAAEAAGCPPGRILARHLLPLLAPTLATLALLQLASLILLESAISFVGAGLAPTTPTLGALAADAALQGTASWWLLVFPGLAIVLPSVACLWAANSLTEAELGTS